MSNVVHDSGSRPTQQEAQQPKLDHIGLEGRSLPKKNTPTRTEIGVAGVPSNTNTLPRETQEEIQRLIGDLGADSFGKRERASRRLSEIGGTAFPALLEALESQDAEVVFRARAIIKNLPLTCKASGKASEICAQLSKANGATIRFAGMDGDVVLSIEQGSLSEILNEICAQTYNVYHISQRGDAEIISEFDAIPPVALRPAPGVPAPAIQIKMMVQKARFGQQNLPQGGDPVPQIHKDDNHDFE